MPFDRVTYKQIVSGEKQGIAASLSRSLLRIAETPYSLAMRWRNRRYDCGGAETHSIGVPVVSVGNLTMGGTGKTPMVEHLARWFRRHGVRVTLISRGYSAEADGQNDEALELEQKLPDVPHLQNADRVAAAHMAVEEFAAQLILLDDAFQHRRIHRDLDIVLIDALEPFGYGHVTPRGLLREPMSGLGRAHCIVLSRADMVDSQRREQIRQQVLRHAPGATWMEASHAPKRLIRSDDRQAEVECLRGQRIAAFCGIGNPAGFARTLRNCGYEVVSLREFPDHHHYQRSDIQSLSSSIGQLDVQAVVCTHKDLVKVGLSELGGKPLWALGIELQIEQGEAMLDELLNQVLKQIPPDGDAVPPTE